MKTRNVKRLLFTILAASVLMVGSGLQGWCSNSVLTAVNIEGTKDTYVVTLKTSKDTQVITRVPSSDKLIVDLSDTAAADLIKTSFKNTNNIQDVIVQPLGADATRLYISGTNVSKSKIIIDSTKTIPETEKFTQDQLQASNNPVVQSKSQEVKQPAQDTQSSLTQPLVDQNSANGVADTSSVDASLDKQETTGVVSAPPADDVTVDPTSTQPQEAASSASGVLDPEVFRPSADLDVPESPAIQKNNSANTTTEVNNQQNGTTNDSLFSNSNLIRFGIVFIFVTVLVAFLRKEKIFAARPKQSRKQLSQEHLDIYRSLHNSVNKAPSGFRTNTTRTSSVSSLKNKNNKSSQKQQSYNNTTLRQVNAMNSYKNNAMKGKSANIPIMKSKALQNNGANSANGNNVEFLKNMVELYEKSGRHDLAVSLQKQLRKANSK